MAATKEGVREREREGVDKRQRTLEDQHTLDLVAAAQAGDAAAMEELTREFWPTIEFHAKRFRFKYRRRSTWQDCLGETWLAFHKLVMSYRDGHGNTFKSYVSNYLKRRLLDALDADDGRLIRVPWSSRAKVGGERISSLSSSVRFKMDESAKESRDFIFGAVLADPKQPRPDAERGLNGFTDGFNQRQRLVLLLYYIEGLTFKQIGEHLGVVESRVSQMHSECIRDLRLRLQFERAFQ